MLASAVLFMAFQCSGSDEELMVSMTASVPSIPADGKSQVKFTVFEGNADVTAQSVIYNNDTNQALPANTFSTTSAGEYFFVAEYKGRKSDLVKVVAEQVVVSKFVRNISLMEFTDAQCAFCPDASRYIDRNILSKNENVHLLAFHEKDQWKSDHFPVLFQKFNLTATPSASVDMRDGIGLETGGRDQLKAAVSESNTLYPAHCGVAVSSTVDPQGLAKVTVKLYSEKSADYYMAAYVVEDGLKGAQLDGSLTEQNYYHQFVVRKLLSATVYGDSMGRIASGSEKTQEYTLSVSSDWNRAKTYVYALAIDSNGYVNNMQVCLLDGGDADYEYIK